MTVTASTTLSARVVPVSDPNHVDLKSSLTFVLIGAVFASLLIPMLIALLVFSTEESRRRWLFNLNALTLVFGIVQGVLLSALYVHTILSPSPNLVHFNLAVNIMFLFAPLFVESILIFRVVAVFPSRVNGLRTIFFVIAFPVVVRIGRVINMSIAIAKTVQASSHGIAEQWFVVLPYARAEWILALLDTTYVSLVFLYRLKIRNPKTARSSIFRGTEITARLRGLFYIAVSNFVLPCILGFVQVILVFTIPDQGSSDHQRITWFYECSYIMITYNYLTIIGVVFATVWSTGSTWASERQNASVSFQSDRMFASSAYSGTTVGHNRNRSIPTVKSSASDPVYMPVMLNDAEGLDNIAVEKPNPSTIPAAIPAAIPNVNLTLPGREFNPLRFEETYEPEHEELLFVPNRRAVASTQT